MSWENILKKVSERERMDAEEFAPKEMQEWRDEKWRKGKEGYLNAIRSLLKVLDSDKTMEEKEFSEIKNSIQQLLRNFEIAPKLRGKSREQAIEVLNDFLEAIE